jgi:DNA-directed RNA polymerase specialized sigma24 family protein
VARRIKTIERDLLAALGKLQAIDPTLARELGWAYGEASEFGISTGEAENHLSSIKRFLAEAESK